MLVFLLVDFAWIFFCADSTCQGAGIIRRIVTQFHLRDVPGILTAAGITSGELGFLVLLIFLVIVADTLCEKQVKLVVWINKQNLVFRWMMYLLISLTVCVCFLRGYGTDASAFIYTRF